MLPASSGGNRVPAIAQLVQTDEDTVRDVIHRFNEIGPARLDLQWAGGRPANSAMKTRISSSRRPPHDRSARSTRYQGPSQRSAETEDLADVDGPTVRSIPPTARWAVILTQRTNRQQATTQAVPVVSIRPWSGGGCGVGGRPSRRGQRPGAGSLRGRATTRIPPPCNSAGCRRRAAGSLRPPAGQSAPWSAGRCPSAEGSSPRSSSDSATRTAICVASVASRSQPPSPHISSPHRRADGTARFGTHA